MPNTSLFLLDASQQVTQSIISSEKRKYPDGNQDPTEKRLKVMSDKQYETSFKNVRLGDQVSFLEGIVQVYNRLGRVNLGSYKSEDLASTLDKKVSATVQKELIRLRKAEDHCSAALERVVAVLREQKSVKEGLSRAVEEPQITVIQECFSNAVEELCILSSQQQKRLKASQKRLNNVSQRFDKAQNA